MTTAKIGKWVSAIMAIVGAASLGTLHLPLGVPASWGDYIVSWSAFVLALYVIINPFLPANTFMVPGVNQGQVSAPPKAVALILAPLVALGLLWASQGPAMAHARKLQCGWPHPEAGCRNPAPAPKPKPAPAPSAGAIADPTDTGGIITGLVTAKAAFIADLQAVALMAGTINTKTNASWDPPALWCINGTPAQGTPGQPGYIPGYAGLLAWVNGLTLPVDPTVNPVPPIPAGGGVAAAAEEVWLKGLAAYQDASSVVNTIVSSLNVSGPPQDVMKPCGALIQDRIQTVQNAVMTTTSQLALFNGILIQFMPKAALAAHVRMLKR